MEADRTLPANRSRLDVAMSELGDRSPRPRDIRTVGRYLLLDELGSGGMGVVYAAYDPELDRRVAVKLVHAPADTQDTAGRAWLLREAQALARLSHPNVVTVHDVGAHAQGVWIAMEFVAGRTLGVWAQERPRRWSDALRVLADAAGGVAAAHAVGLVHRDLKLDNIMIGNDGRVRVMDFGLAHGRARAAEPALAATLSANSVARPELAALELRLTRAGALLGTPAYMAPEQWRGLEVDAAADQFSWSVMAWELLYGEPPFVGETALTLAAAVLSGQRKTPPKGRKVPGWLRRLVERGLAVAPDQRWPTMADLLAALERGRSRARSRTAGVVLASATALAGGVVGIERWVDAAQTDACVTAGAEIDRLWNDAARQRLRDAFTATGLGFAADAADHTIPWIDRNVAAWRAARTEVCLDAIRSGDWPPDLLDRAVWCLEDRRIALESLVAELHQADQGGVEYAVTAAAGLADMTPCATRDILQRLPSPPSDQRDEIAATRKLLARADSLRLTRHYKKALDLTATARANSEVLAWLPLLAAAQYQEGKILVSSDEPQRAGHTLRAAYFNAAGVGAWDVAADAATMMINVSDRREQELLGREWAQHAEMASLHAGDALHLREAERLQYLSNIEFDADAYDVAGTLNERALYLFEAALGPDHPHVADALLRMAGNVGFNTPERAHWAERALTGAERAFGDSHPNLLPAISTLAMYRRRLGATETSLALTRRTLAISEMLKDDVWIGPALANIGIEHLEAGEYSVAEDFVRRSVVAREQSFGLNNLQVTWSLPPLIEIHEARGAYSEAMKLHERIIKIDEEVLGPDHHILVRDLDEYGRSRQRLGDAAQARELFERGRAIQDRVRGPTSLHYASSLVSIALLDLDTGAPAAARSGCEQALAIAEHAPRSAEIITSLECLADIGDATGDHESAVTLRERVLTSTLSELGPDAPLLARRLIGLADSLRAAGDLSAARSRCDQALKILEKAYPDRAPVAEALECLAAVHSAAGAHAAAKPIRERALAIWEAALGPDAPAVARSRERLADTYTANGARAEARGLYTIANTSFERLLGAGHLHAMPSLVGLARLDLVEGKRQDALARLERAIRVYDAHAGVQDGELTARFHLATLLITSRRDRERAVKEAEEAHEGLRNADRAEDSALLDEVESWLKSHRADIH